MKTVTTIKAALGFDETGKRISKLRVCAYCRVSTMHENSKTLLMLRFGIIAP